jgi:hypothetical protein
MKNPIIDEVRANRAALAAEHGYDREKILAWARAEQAAIKNKGTSKSSPATASVPAKSRGRKLTPSKA